MVLKCSECGGEVQEIAIWEIDKPNTIVYHCTGCNKTIKKSDNKTIDMSGLEVIME